MSSKDKSGGWRLPRSILAEAAPGASNTRGEQNHRTPDLNTRSTSIITTLSAKMDQATQGQDDQPATATTAAPPPSSFDNDADFYEESRWQKLRRKIVEEPLIPLGCALTCWALYEA